MTGTVSWILSLKAIADALIGLGVIKGKNCQVKSIVRNGTATVITFAWYDEDEELQEMSFTMYDGVDGINGVDGQDGAPGDPGANGVSVVSAEITATHHLVFTMSNDTTIDAGVISGGGGEGGSDVIANPELEGDETELESLGIDGTNYKILSGTGLTKATKEALMNCFEHVAWTDEHGQTYYDALAEAIGYNPEPPTQKVLESITAIINNPTVEQNTTYVPNVSVTAHYSDGSIANVSAQAVFGSIDTATTGAKTLSISYTENSVTKTTSGTVTVTSEPVSVVLSSISATKTKMSYTTEETFGTDDVIVTAHYSDGTSANVTNNAEIGTVDISTAGTKTLNISYTEGSITKTATLSITVTVADEPRGQIALSLVDGKKINATNGHIGSGDNYAADETYHDLRSGMTYTITGVATAGHTIKVCYYSAQSESSFVSYEQILGQASKVLTIPEGANYLRMGCFPSADRSVITFTESSGEKVLSSITATKVKTQYTQDEPFNTDDVSVTALYSNGLSENVTSSAVIGSVDTSITGEKTLSISYTENGVTKTTTITITVATGGSARGNIPLNLVDDKQLAFSQSGKVVSKTNNAADETFYQVFSGFTYTLTGSTSAGNTTTVCYYSANNQPSYISYEQITNELGSGTKVLTIPEGANYLRIGCYTMGNKSEVTLTES